MGNFINHNSSTINTGAFLKLPAADGTNGQVISTNGSGTLAFADSFQKQLYTGISPSVIDKRCN